MNILQKFQMEHKIHDCKGFIFTIPDVSPTKVDIYNTSGVHQSRDSQDKVAPVGEVDEPLDLLLGVMTRPLPAVDPGQDDTDHVEERPKQAPYQVRYRCPTVLELSNGNIPL